MTSCKYNIGHQKLCGKDAADGSKYCHHHSTRLCVSCREQATHNCTNEKESICGCALCSECVHVDLPNGANGMLYQHARLGEEISVPHYAKDVFKGK